MAEVLIKNLYKIFDRTEAVSGIDLSIKDKEFKAIDPVTASTLLIPDATEF